MATILSIASVFLVGCSTHFSTMSQAPGQTIYRMSQDQALQIAHRAIAQVLPGNVISGVSGPSPGYKATSRMMLDTYSQQVVAVPATGLDDNRPRFAATGSKYQEVVPP